MALETRHTEKQLLFNILKAIHRDPKLQDSIELDDTVKWLKATMEPEDVMLVCKQIAELR